MKVRNGFVSNSSSSSFIIGIPAEEDTKDLKIIATLNLADLVEKKITTENGLLEYYIDSNGLDWYMDEKGLTFEEALEKDGLTEGYTTALECIKEGGIVVVLHASNDDYGVGTYLYENGLPELDKKYKVISNEN